MQVFFSTPLYACIDTHPNFINDFHSRALIFSANRPWVHYCANQLGCRDFERPAVMAPGLPSSRYIGFISDRKWWNCRAYLHTGQFKTMCTPMTRVTSHFHHKYFSFPLASSNMALSVKKNCLQQLENTYILGNFHVLEWWIARAPYANWNLDILMADVCTNNVGSSSRLLHSKIYHSSRRWKLGGMLIKNHSQFRLDVHTRACWCWV